MILLRLPALGCVGDGNAEITVLEDILVVAWALGGQPGLRETEGQEYKVGFSIVTSPA